jgi:hypothetical protein
MKNCLNISVIVLSCVFALFSCKQEQEIFPQPQFELVVQRMPTNTNLVQLIVQPRSDDAHLLQKSDGVWILYRSVILTRNDSTFISQSWPSSNIEPVTFTAFMPQGRGEIRATVNVEYRTRHEPDRIREQTLKKNVYL